jgi:hypothetical protein
MTIYVFTTISCVFAVGYLVRLAMLAKFGSLSQNEPYFRGAFVGAFVGSFIFPAIGVLIYYTACRIKPHPAKVVCLIAAWALVPAFLALNRQVMAPQSTRDKMIAREVGKEWKEAKELPSPDKISNRAQRATYLYFRDLQSQREQYLADVSKIDVSGPRTYSPESFRDASAMQSILSQLNAWLAINKKYALTSDDLESKLKSVLDLVGATQAEKQEYVEGFESEGKDAMREKIAVSGLERSWLLSAIDLYQFPSAHHGSYSVGDRRIIFRSQSDSDAFNRKMAASRTLQSQFLQANAKMRQREDAALAEAGLQRSDLDQSKRQ